MIVPPYIAAAGVADGVLAGAVCCAGSVVAVAAGGRRLGGRAQWLCIGMTLGQR